ncbi:MAG TPA: PAS domain S-box protein [Chryseolinea sp.]
MVPKKRAIKKRPQKKSKSKRSKSAPEKATERQHHIDMALEAARVGIWEWFIKTDKVRWSKIVYEIFGITKKEFKGDLNSYRKMVHPEDRQVIANAIHETTANKKVYFVQHRVIRPDGTIRWLEASGNGIWNKQGEMVKLTGTAQDITERKNAEIHFLESEQSYKTLFNSVEEAIYIQDHDGTFMDVNDGACKMYGYNRSEFIGRSPAFLAAEGKNDFNLVAEKIKMASSGIPQTLEFWAKKKNGEEFLKEVRIAKGFYFGKEMLISTARDITERKKFEEELRESEQRFRTLQQASFGGIGIHDKGKIMDCNQGLIDITGYSRDELIGSDGLRLVAPEWRDHVMEKILSGAEKPYDVEGIRKDGSRFSLEVQAKNIPYQGKMIRVTEFRDITERKLNEAKIMEQNSRLLSITEDLKRKNEQLEEFTQIVSHNLRSPVGNILTLINFFETSEKEDEKAEYLSLLKESGHTTQQTLHQLNEVLKIKQNKKIPRQKLDFERVLHQVKTMLSAKITESSATIESDFSQAPTILYPNIYLESIFLNLLSNSLKYVDPARKAVVVFKTFQSNSNIILEARDNGLGINLERYGHQIFKLHKTFHRHPESRGIGLFMIKNQIEALGGEISVASQVDKGTTIFVNFNKYNLDAAEDTDNSVGR